MSIDELKTLIKDEPISKIIGHYIPLTRRGNQTLAICPFHQDTKPSLNINDGKGMFMCFACNTGGDHFTFVEKYRNINFIESLKEICEILNLEFDDFKTKSQKNPEIEMARKILTKAVEIYQRVAEESPNFKDFIQQRKLKPETIENFKLGFAPGSNILSKYLTSIPDPKDRDFALKTALKMKLIHPDKKVPNQYFDSFRNRIMFPIFDQYNNPMGFTSRATLPNQKPKYLNSSESLTFIKKKLLYGVNLAKSSIRSKNQLILCEGNMDVITLHQKGFTNAVAIMGTAYNGALTPIIKGLSKNIIFALDNDTAGLEATKKINSLLMSEEIYGRYLPFAPCKDPDEFLNQFSSIELEKRIGDSTAFVDYELKQPREKNQIETTEQKINLIKKAFDAISPLKKSVSAKERISDFAQKIGLKSTVEDLFEEFYQKDHFLKPELKNKTTSLIKAQADGPSPRNPDTQGLRLRKSTQAAIREIIRNPEIMESEIWSEVLDLLSPDEVKMWFTSVQKIYFEVDDKNFNSMILDALNRHHLSNDFKSLIGAAIYNSEDRTPLEEKGRDQLINDLVKLLKKDQLVMKRESLLKRHDSADSNQQEEILREINNIQIEIKNIN